MDTDLLECSIALIHEDKILHGIIGDDQIEPAVAIEIDGDDPHSLGDRDIAIGILNLNSRSGRNILELAATFVAVQIRIGADKRRRRPVSPGLAIQFKALHHVDVTRPADIVSHKQIEIPVVIEIEERRTGAPLLRIASYSGIVGGFYELPVIIAKEPILAHGGEKHIGPAIGIIVTTSDPHAVKGHAQTRIGGHILEFAVAVILIKFHGWRRARRCSIPRPRAGIDEQQVLVAVIVVVQKCAARSHGFGQ